MTPAELVATTDGLPEIVLSDGHTVLTDGERTHALFVLVRGALEVRRNGIPVTRIADPGAVVGELGLLLDVPATADVVAVGEAVVRRVDDGASFLDEHPGFARYLATLLARRLWQVSTYLSDLQTQFADRTDIIGLLPDVMGDLLSGHRAEPDLGSDREAESPY